MIGTRSIRRQLLLSLAIMVAVVLIVYVPLADRLIDSRFESFEINEAEDEAWRLELLIQERIDRLRAHAVNYADWGRTADYVRGIGEGYIEENVYSDILMNFDTDAVFIVNRDLSMRYFAKVPANINSASGLSLEPLPTSALTPLLADVRIRGLLDRAEHVSFIARIDGRWRIVAASSITYPSKDSNKTVHGILGFITELSPQRVMALGRLTGVPFTLSEDLDRSSNSRLEGDDVVMSRILHDDRGQAMAALDIRYPQPLTKDIRATRVSFFSVTIGVFSIGALLLWWLIDRGLISRLERAHLELKAMREGRRKMLSLSGRGDEVDDLANEFNLAYAEIKRINQQWRHEALHDSLTGLGNRALLIQSIESFNNGRTSTEADASTDEERKVEIRAQPPLWLMLIDLDDFKTINDLFGHGVGDNVLVNVAERLRRTLPSNAESFRLGGDEFAVLVEGMTSEQVRDLANDINQWIKAENFTDRGPGALSVSIGIARHDMTETTNAATRLPSALMQRADIALYTIKHRSRDGNALFDESMLDEMLRHNDLLFRLRNAIDADRIDVHFQPIIDAQSGRAISFEVLARWHDDQIGRVEPSRFIALAEQNFLSDALDRSVLRQALRALPQLHRLAPDVGISVNASVQSLFDQGYVSLVAQLLAEFGLSGDLLRIEITETTLAMNEDALSRPLSLLQAQGAKIELDDFGIGYSSLSRLAQIGPHAIKLDASFLHKRHLDNGRACRAVIGLAHEMGIAVTGECVESEDEAEFLRASGCEALQGYLFSPPLALNEALDWLRKHQAVVQGHDLAYATQ
jgi:diguanylate cyclase (GGDEF)-like protein